MAIKLQITRLMLNILMHPARYLSISTALPEVVNTQYFRNKIMAESEHAQIIAAQLSELNTRTPALLLEKDFVELFISSSSHCEQVIRAFEEIYYHYQPFASVETLHTLSLLGSDAQQYANRALSLLERRTKIYPSQSGFKQITQTDHLETAADSLHAVMKTQKDGKDALYYSGREEKKYSKEWVSKDVVDEFQHLPLGKFFDFKMFSVTTCDQIEKFIANYFSEKILKKGFKRASNFLKFDNRKINDAGTYDEIKALFDTAKTNLQRFKFPRELIAAPALMRGILSQEIETLFGRCQLKVSDDPSARQVTQEQLKAFRDDCLQAIPKKEDTKQPISDLYHAIGALLKDHDKNTWFWYFHQRLGQTAQSMEELIQATYADLIESAQNELAQNKKFSAKQNTGLSQKHKAVLFQLSHLMRETVSYADKRTELQTVFIYDCDNFNDQARQKVLTAVFFHLVAKLDNKLRPFFFDNLKTVEKFENFLKNKRSYSVSPQRVAAYIESVEMIIETVVELINQLPDGQRTPKHEFLLEEIMRCIEFPSHRCDFLQTMAKVESEVLAQELRRALAPVDLLGRNPYPKYRVSTPNTRTVLTESQKVHERAYGSYALPVVPSVPRPQVSSEKINFYSEFHYNRYSEHDLRKPYFRDVGPQKVPVHFSTLKGVGVACFFAKFLGDRDAKISNLGINFEESHSSPAVMTALDSGWCFSNSLRHAPPLFQNHEEVVQNPQTHNTQAFHHYFLAIQGGHRGHHEHGKPFSSFFDEFMEKLAEESQVKSENFATAFHCAFLSPEVYTVFSEQYLTSSNPFVELKVVPSTAPQRKILLPQDPKKQPPLSKKEQILNGHLLKEQKALYQLFDTHPSFLEFFLNSERPEDNLFHRYQQLVSQVEFFRFYEKKDFRSLPEFHENPQMIEGPFLKFIVTKFKADPEMQKKIIQAFQQWDPTKVLGPSHVSPKELTERGENLKQRVAEVLGLEYTRANLEKTQAGSEIIQYSRKDSQQPGKDLFSGPSSHAKK